MAKDWKAVAEEARRKRAEAAEAGRAKRAAARGKISEATEAAKQTTAEVNQGIRDAYAAGAERGQARLDEAVQRYEDAKQDFRDAGEAVRESVRKRGLFGFRRQPKDEAARED